MKYLYVLLLLSMCCKVANAQLIIDKDTSANRALYDDHERRPEFPGGAEGFSKYIRRNLKYPLVARLLGLNGKVSVSFVIDRDGKLTNVLPLNCLGAGCGAEAQRVLEVSPNWKPGIEDDKPARFQYTVPITFDMGKKSVKTNLSSLRNSRYGFVFNIKDTLYTINEAEKILGTSFNANKVKSAELFYNYDKLPQFDMPNKKKVYLITMKSN